MTHELWMVLWSIVGSLSAMNKRIGWTIFAFVMLVLNYSQVNP